MPISLQQKKKILQVVNVFETGTKEGKYDDISIYADGPIIDGKRIKQITYGRSQTTEYGVLKILVQQYIANNGISHHGRRVAINYGSHSNYRSLLTVCQRLCLIEKPICKHRLWRWSFCQIAPDNANSGKIGSWPQFVRIRIDMPT